MAKRRTYDEIMQSKDDNNEPAAEPVAESFTYCSDSCKPARTGPETVYSSYNLKENTTTTFAEPEIQQKFDLRMLEANVANCLQIIDDEVMKGYVTKLPDLPIILPEFDEEKMKNEPYQWFHITKIVYEKDEFSVSKLATVFQTVAGKNSTLVLMIQNVNHRANFYLGVRNHEDKDFTGTLRQMLETSLRGQFPGSDFDTTFDINCMEAIKNQLRETTKSVSSVTCVPDFKQGKDFFENKDFYQGLEKFVISMQAKDYTALFVADAVPYDELNAYRTELESVYTQLSPFANMQYQLSSNKSSSTGTTSSENITDTKSDSISEQYGTNVQNSHSVGNGTTNTSTESLTHTVSNSETYTRSDGKTVTDGTMQSSTDSKATTNTVSSGASLNSSTFSSVTHSVANAISADVSANGGAAGSAIGAAIGSVIPGAGTVLGGIIGGAVGKGITASVSKSVTNTVANTVGKSLGMGVNAGYSRAVTNSHSDTTGTNHSVGISQTISKALTKGTSDSKSFGTSNAVSKNETDTASLGISAQQGKSESYSKAFSFGHAETLTDSIGSSKGLTIQSQNLMIGNMLERIKKQIERIDECESIGMWNSAVYFMSENKAISETAASTYRSLVSGEKSGVERSAINTWATSDKLPYIKEYLTHFCHPKFQYYIPSEDTEYIVSPSALVSTKELAIQMSLPKKSICGLPVAEHAVFGQEVIINGKSNNDENKKTIDIGRIFHLNSTEKTKVQLDVDSLSMHTFVTGSTGSGKSNTVYHLLDELNNSNIKVPYLVIEPAKGEYKSVFKTANIYGTNPNNSKLLKINPFSFPTEIHVQEHIDKLVEIFNVCWPMYAAMPAVLKDSVIRAYETAGWDMAKSINLINDNLFPTFEDVLRELENVVNDADYSNDTSSDYKGALKTRLRSLTNGINGMIFSNKEVSYELLFDSNTIVDLSRVGSTETKSLIMGMIVLKLQEYRMSQNIDANSHLRHVTVIEEAHNLLKKTSTEQNQEGSNLQGKSVEMLTNVIAEMRTYGEGFVIVDQAPDLLDTAVIRNTNTKIIMRLPEGTDREITGMSMALNKEQIQELSKLPTGIAAVYQNNWQEAVLCDIPKYKIWDLPKPKNNDKEYMSEKEILRKILSNDSSFKDDITISDAPAAVRKNLIQYFDTKNLFFEWAMADYIASQFPWKSVFDGTNRTCSTIDELGNMMLVNSSNIFSEFSKDENGKICYYICRKAHEEYPSNTLIEDVRVNFFKARWML